MNTRTIENKIENTFCLTNAGEFKELPIHTIDYCPFNYRNYFLKKFCWIYLLFNPKTGYCLYKQAESAGLNVEEIAHQQEKKANELV